MSHALEPLGVPPEDRSFVPHLTLARFKISRSAKPGRSNPPNGEALRTAAAEMAEKNFGTASETNFHLFESITKPTGSEYGKLETYSFVKGPE
jgi:2'-5' RNA ligase